MRSLTYKVLNVLILSTLYLTPGVLASTTPPDATESVTPITNASTAVLPYATISTIDSQPSKMSPSGKALRVSAWPVITPWLRTWLPAWNTIT